MHARRGKLPVGAALAGRASGMERMERHGAIDALELDLTLFGGRDDTRDAPVDVLAEEDLPRLGGALDPRGHVHHRAGDGEFLAGLANLADRGLSGMDADADADAERGAAALQPRSL